MKIAIFSSRHSEDAEAYRELAEQIGHYLSEKGITVVTGGCSGIPAIIVETAHQHGARTIGYFPLRDQADYHGRRHENNIHALDYYTTANFISGYTARSLEMIKHVDAAIMLNGRMGTLSEFIIALEEKIPVAVIEGTGGTSDALRHIVNAARKDLTDKPVFFEQDYRAAIDRLIANYANNIKTHS